MDPLVSIVIPTYNHAHFLGRALQSVLDQTYAHWEALVVDNHSEDNTEDVVATVSDHRIRLLKIHNHGVIAASRNLGIREASGEWIAFLDSDDCWYPRKLDTIMTAAAGNAFDVLSNDELRVDTRTGEKTVLRYGPYHDEFYQVLLVEGNRLSPSATVVRRRFLVEHGLGFDESTEFVTAEDYGFWLDVARAGARFCFIHDVQGEFVVHGGGSSAQLSRHLQSGEALLRHHVFKIQRFHPSPATLWRQLSPRLRIAQVRRLAGGGQPAAALRLLLKSLFEAPGAMTKYVLSKAGQRLRRVGR